MAYIRWRVMQVTVDAVTWTDINIPQGVAVRSISLYNSDANDIKIRSTKVDATTEKTLAAGQQEVFAGEAQRVSGGDYRDGMWLPGETVCSIQAAAGVGPIIVTIYG